VGHVRDLECEQRVRFPTGEVSTPGGAASQAGPSTPPFTVRVDLAHCTEEVTRRMGQRTGQSGIPA
jgi:hypothetical protein